MAVGSGDLPLLRQIPGVRIGTVSAGIRKANRPDLVVFELAEGSSLAAVFTRNRFCAAPVLVARRHLALSSPRFLVINTGNANAGTGAAGLRDAARVCEALASQTRVPVEAVLPFSTGVIGEPLPVERIVAALPEALRVLDPAGWEGAATGILTTDTRPKGASRELVLGETQIRITGIAKGAGMIRPDMATMLAFVATDLAVASDILQGLLADAVAKSFNRITIDGDTSTNDAVALVATGSAEAAPLSDARDRRLPAFRRALTDVCTELAHAIVRDGEGATKFVAVDVSGGRDETECLQVAYAIAQSPLVKTALFASDPNWGRLLAAIGRAGVYDLDVEGVRIHINGVLIAERGCRAASYSEERGAAAMAPEEIVIAVDLGRGGAASRVWTTDLSHDYVSINADYRS